MDLIERYVAAVRRHLPQAQRADIGSELTENLRSAVEEREAGLGRALAPEEVSDLLRGHGHPWVVANRYLPQQYLIGPALYPYYRQAITAILFWILLPAIPIAIAVGTLLEMGAGGPAMTWLRALSGAWTTGLILLGLTTIVFAVLEGHQVRITLLDRWRPEALPTTPETWVVSRGDAAVRLAFDTIFLLWWVGALRLPAFPAGHDVQLSAAGVWQAAYTPILIVTGMSILIAVADLARPWPHRRQAMARLAVDGANLVLVLALMAGGPWVVVGSDTLDAAAVTMRARWLNWSILATLAVVAVIQTVDFVTKVRRWSHLTKAYTSATAGRCSSPPTRPARH